MKNTIKNIFCIFLCAVFVATLFSACSDSVKKIDFIYPFSADINSYDPQIAETADEFLIIENTFEGLIRIDDDGTVKKGCADSWDISKDGLTYTFKIKEGLKWDISLDKYKEGTKKGEYKDKRLRRLKKEFNPDITANDFVFALRRAVMPQTDSKLFPSVSVIKNAVDIHSGKMNVNQLGVTAKDEHTLVISLSSPDSNFLQTLTTSIAMPCNEEFFNECKGRYGISEEYTLFNGQFYVDQILQESYLLKKNKNYKGEFPAKGDELTLKIVKDEDRNDSKKSVTARLESGYYDAAFISGSESEKLKKAKGINYVPYQDTTWFLMLNTKNELFQSKYIRKALCLGMARPEKPEKSYLSDSRSFIPSSCTVEGKSVAEAIGPIAPLPDSNESIKLWNKGIKILDITEISFTIITTPEAENVLKAHLQGIQSGISTVTKTEKGDTISYSIKVEVHEENELLSLLRTGSYDAAFYPYKSVSTSAEAFLKGFSSANRTGFDSKKFDAAILKAEKAKSSDEELAFLKQAEVELVNTYSIFPLLSETSYYASARGVSDIQFHAGSGRVSFVNAKRK